MLQKDQYEKFPFVKYYPGLSYMFSLAETRFIIHMLDIEFKKKNGYNTNWTRAKYMKLMGMNEYNFDKSVKRLVELNLLEKTNNSSGNRVYFSFNMDLFFQLVKILSATCNVNKLIAFCDKNFKENNRRIDSITDDEIKDLASNKDITLEHPSMY